MSFRNNCELDAVLVGVINSATSLYGAIPIFAILGFKANSAYNSCMKECVCTHILGYSETHRFFLLILRGTFALQKHLGSDQPL